MVAVVVQEGGQAAADADVGFHAGVFGVFGVHVVAFFVGDHLQGEFVVVAQEDAPLAGFGDFGGLGHDLGDGVALFAADGHEDAGHDGEVEGHVAFVAAGGGVAEVFDDVGGPLVGFGEQDAVGVEAVDFGADAFEVGVGFGEVLAVGAFAGVQVGDGVQAESVDAQVEPEAQVLQHGVLDVGVVVVEVGLVGEEAVPVVLAADGVVGPVGGFGVDEDDAGFGVAGVVVGPHVEVPERPVRIGPRRLEPWMLVGGVVHHQIRDHPDTARMRLLDEFDEVTEFSEVGQDAGVVRDVVAAVFER
ncbi:Uncharacterised protein [Mycobacterium tuberculosis]|nr:Uncharacterised protein [Mycobacterium tuberculosis]